MGHLFSRALRRISQCTTNQSRNNPEQQEQNQRGAGDDDQRQQQQQQRGEERQTGGPMIAQSIPVGQSIDSAEYNVLESNKNIKAKNVAAAVAEKKRKEEEASRAEKEDNYAQKENRNDNATTTTTINTQDENNKQQGVEEAVIKIQALVRGHLTRKALKDAQHHSLPAPNALGQSQFDADSLTRDPLSPVFLSPLNFNDQNPHQPPAAASLTNARSPLESIAEVTETTTNQQQQQPAAAVNNDPTVDKQNELDSNSKRKLSPLNTRSASSPSKIEIPSSYRQDSISRSPVPSEANASIDLCCETPASASIDILDHNIKPIDKMASVLHHKTNIKQEQGIEKPLSINQEKLVTAFMQQEEQQQNRGEEEHSAGPLVETSKSPDSFESEEAAAIRIQSAFRGYRTRKNSPYRTRSPNSLSAQAKRNALIRQQQAGVLLESDDLDAATKEAEIEISGDNEKLDVLLEPNEQIEASEQAQSDGRRLSRPRQREPSPVIQEAPSMEEFTTTENTVREVDGQTTGIQVPTQRSLETVRGQNESFDVTSNSLTEPAATDTLDEIGMSAALESQTTNNDGSAILGIRRTPEKESEASVEMDTDSSALGGALSLNESDTASDIQPQQSVASAPPNLDPIDEMDKSTGFSITDELESEAKRLIDELESAELQQLETAEVSKGEEENDFALEEATNELESVLEAATDGIDSLLPDEEEQRAIELESDDIERKDPRGHDRQSKSPQIRMKKPSLTNQDDNSGGGGGELVQENEEENFNMEALKIEQLMADETSGRSSPALVSSANGSSDEDNSDHEDEQQNQQQQQQQQQNKPPGGKNKKRNRNKKKNKK